MKKNFCLHCCYIFILSIVFFSCGEESLSIDNQDVNMEISTRSDCELDWDVSYHNDDDDFCRNVRIQVNGLMGSDCDDCEIRAYTLTLNRDESVVGMGKIKLGSWAYVEEYNKFVYSKSYNAVTPNPFVSYNTFAHLQSLAELGSGEVVEFDFLAGAFNDVPLCVEMLVRCDDGYKTLLFCDLVDLLCW